MLKTVGLVLGVAVLLVSAFKESFDEELAIAALPTRDHIAYNFRFDLTTASLNGEFSFSHCMRPRPIIIRNSASQSSLPACARRCGATV